MLSRREELEIAITVELSALQAETLYHQQVSKPHRARVVNQIIELAEQYLRDTKKEMKK